MQKCLAALIITLAAWTALAKEAQPAVSLRYSCFHKPFLSVSVSTLQHDSFPDVQLRLIAPGHRIFGHGSRLAKHPAYRYGRVLEIPNNKRSRAVAVELCDAMPGDFAVEVSENRNDEYRLSIRADDGQTGNDGMESTFLSREGQTCTFHFRVQWTAYHILNVRWLKSTEHVQTADTDPACELSVPISKPQIAHKEARIWHYPDDEQAIVSQEPPKPYTANGLLPEGTVSIQTRYREPGFDVPTPNGAFWRFTNVGKLSYRGKMFAIIGNPEGIGSDGQALGFVTSVIIYDEDGDGKFETVVDVITNINGGDRALAFHLPSWVTR